MDHSIKRVPIIENWRFITCVCRVFKTKPVFLSLKIMVWKSVIYGLLQLILTYNKKDRKQPVSHLSSELTPTLMVKSFMWYIDISTSLSIFHRTPPLVSVMPFIFYMSSYCEQPNILKGNNHPSHKAFRRHNCKWEPTWEMAPRTITWMLFSSVLFAPLSKWTHLIAILEPNKVGIYFLSLPLSASR